MPRQSRDVAEKTRTAIVREAVDDASLNGLEGITIGRLAERLEMSKAGVIGPFGSKEELQLAAIDAAAARFRETVWDRAADTEEGLPRLEALIDAWLLHLTGGVFPGGCFLTQAAADFDGRRQGPVRVRDAIVEMTQLWESILAREVRIALEKGEIEGVEPEQAAFEIHALGQGVNQAHQLRRDPKAAERGRAGMLRALRP
jgi:AcrR family transcriptional regulator